MYSKGRVFAHTFRTTCHSQILSQKELCDEKVEAVKLEIKKKMEKLNPAPSGLSVVSQQNLILWEI